MPSPQLGSMKEWGTIKLLKKTPKTNNKKWYKCSVYYQVTSELDNVQSVILYTFTSYSNIGYLSMVSTSAQEKSFIP